VKVLVLDPGNTNADGLNRIEFDPANRGQGTTAKDDIVLVCEGGEKVAISRFQLFHFLKIEPALRATEECMKAHKKNKFFGLFIVGKPGSGKSSYVIRMLSEVYGRCSYDSHIFRLETESGEYRELPLYIVWEHKWDAWKEWLVFLPDQFVKKLSEVQATARQEKMMGWDDAGVWLSKYNWASEFSQGVSDQFEVIRRSFASVVFTCPNSKKLLKSIRDFPAMAKGKPAEVRGDDDKRRIKVYERDINLADDKEYPNKLFDEYYNVMLPDDVFAEYDPVSRMYGKIVTIFLEKALKDLRERGAYRYAEAVKEMADLVKQ
jgi:hypothetical protein